MPPANRVYPYLCRAVRNFARDRGGVSVTKEFYVAFEDVPTRHKLVIEITAIVLVNSLAVLLLGPFIFVQNVVHVYRLDLSYCRHSLNQWRYVHEHVFSAKTQ